MKVPLYKMYKKVHSSFVLQKSMSIFKWPVKVPDILNDINVVAKKEQTIMKQPLFHDECPIPEELETEKSSGQIFRSILSWPKVSLSSNPYNDSETSFVKKGTHKKVLFIGPSENPQPDTLKRQFYERLKLLPKWDYTEYYSCYAAILDCNPER